MKIKNRSPPFQISKIRVYVRLGEFCIRLKTSLDKLLACLLLIEFVLFRT